MPINFKICPYSLQYLKCLGVLIQVKNEWYDKKLWEIFLHFHHYSRNPFCLHSPNLPNPFNPPFVFPSFSSFRLWFFYFEPLEYSSPTPDKRLRRLKLLDSYFRSPYSKESLHWFCLMSHFYAVCANINLRTGSLVVEIRNRRRRTNAMKFSFVVNVIHFNKDDFLMLSIKMYIIS